MFVRWYVMLRKVLLVTVIVLAFLFAYASSGNTQGSCAIEGFVYVDADKDGKREQWNGETGVLDGVTVRLNGFTRVTSGGWYGFSNLPAGTYTITEEQPAGYVSTSPDAITVTNCSARVIDKNFGEVAGGVSPTPMPVPTAVPTSVPLPALPFKGGLAIGNEVTLEVAQRMGVRRVLLYWGTPTLVNEALSRGLVPVVGLSDCNMGPARWGQLATVAKDHPGLTYMWLNEPDIKAQSGASCGAARDPYDDGYDLTKAVRQFAAVTGMVLAVDSSARFIYGNEAVAQMTWTNRFRGHYEELYGDFGRLLNTILGSHLYPRWWAGESVSNLAGYSRRLALALAATKGDIIITELSADGASDQVALFQYLDAILTAEPRVEAYYWLSWQGARILDASGNFTPLGRAFVEESQR